MPQRTPFGFTALELLLLIAMIVVVIGILLATMRSAKKNAALQYEGADLRAMHTALTEYGTGNKGWFPGLLSNGDYPTASFAQGWRAKQENSPAAGRKAGSLPCPPKWLTFERAPLPQTHAAEAGSICLP